MKVFLFSLCIALSIVECNSSKNKVDLGGMKWALQTLNGKEVKLSDSDSEIFIWFDEEEQRVSGRGGCNRFFGNYELDAEQLKFLPIGSTKMSCPDLKIETEFFQMLEKVDSYSVENEELSFLSKGKDVIAVFKKKTEEPQ